MTLLKTFDDPDVISVDSDDDVNIPTIAFEIERAAKLYTDRERLKRKTRPKIRPLYEEERQIRFKSIRPAIYKCFCFRPKSKKVELRCRHFGNFQLDRDILTAEEHITYLAQPKKHKHKTIEERIRCYFVKRYLPNCTARIDTLAIPDTRRIEHTWNNYSNQLSVRQLNSLSKYLLFDKKNAKFTDIERAIMLVREERHQKLVKRTKLKRQAEKIKRSIIDKRKCQIKEVVWGIFEIMKDFLMNEHDIELEGEMKSLSNIILWNTTQFASYQIPSANSKEFLDKFLVNLAKNITIWMEKFTTNFGFAPLFKHDLDDLGPEYPFNPVDKHKRLPIDDYIPLSESSESDEDDIITEHEEEDTE